MEYTPEEFKANYGMNMATVEPIKVEIEILHEWQLCPKCNGAGEFPVYPGGFAASEGQTAIICNLCNGKKIISKVTGNPPE